MIRASTAPALLAFGATHVGRRRAVNEDRFHVDPARGIFIVVDGVGGHAAGDKAADTAIAAIIERLERETGAVADRVREAITIANNEIHRLAASRPEWRGMACVATVAVVDGDQVVVGHVGDSRLYRLAGGTIEKVTPDHSPVGEREDANEMSEHEAMRHPRRNEVYRDLGSEPHEVSDADFVFVATIDLPSGSALLLCSDGLTDLVQSETIRRLAATHAGAPKALVHALIDAANDAGGKDNVTAVYVERPHDASAADARGAAYGRRARGRAGRMVLTAVAVAGAVAAGFWLGFQAAGRGWSVPTVASSSPGNVIVRADESIAGAIAAALPGTTIVVEPGEYRERLTLRDGIRVVSRVPRGATIRLPFDAAESDAAVAAAGVTNAELSGFRIVGDAASPLGVGVITRDAAVRLVDLDISGALTAAMDLGAGGDVGVSGGFIHDNPGSALVIRTRATPRVTNTVFALNASSDPMSAAVVVEAGATPVWSQNVFHGMTLDAVVGLDAGARGSLSRHNWFVTPAPSATPAGRRQGPGR